VRKALDLEPDLAESHAAMGVMCALQLDWELARKYFEKALTLQPLNQNRAHILASYAEKVLLPLGELARAEQLLVAASDGDPLSPGILTSLGQVQIAARHFEAAIATLQRAAAYDATPFGTNNLMARALTYSGKPQQAIALFESNPANQNWERWLTPAYRLVSRQKDVDRLVAVNADDRPYRQALVYSAIGDKERTFKALMAAAVDSPQRTAVVLQYPEMEFLRGDPRLDDVRKLLKLQ